MVYSGAILSDHGPGNRFRLPEIPCFTVEAASRVFVVFQNRDNRGKFKILWWVHSQGQVDGDGDSFPVDSRCYPAAFPAPGSRSWLSVKSIGSKRLCLLPQDVSSGGKGVRNGCSGEPEPSPREGKWLASGPAASCLSTVLKL